jgi:cell division protein FtsW (lipid II flippase)
MIAADAPTLFARLLAGALTTIFFTYAFVNMGMVSGILPVVGVPLPFVSYGGTAMVTLGLALGMLMSVARSRRLASSSTMGRPRPGAVGLAAQGAVKRLKNQLALGLGHAGA